MPWVALLLVFLISLPLVTARFYASDEIEYFAYLRSLWFDGDLSFDNEYRYFYEHGIAQGGRPRPDGAGRYGDLFYKTFLENTTATGRRTNLAPIGTALLWAPLYALTDAGVRVARALGSEVPADGFSRPYIAAATYGSALYGFLAVLLSAVAIRRVVGGGVAAVIAAWLGTPLLFYMYVAPPFSHACSAFGVALFTYVWLRVRDTWPARGMIALGAAAALMAMVREQDAFFVAGPAVDVLWSRVSQARGARREAGGRRFEAGTWIGVAGAVVAFVAAFTPQAVTYWILNGHLGPHASVGRKMNWIAPHSLQVLFSPEHGFFVWTPLALMAIAGLVYLCLPPKGGSYKTPDGGGSYKTPDGGGSYKTPDGGGNATSPVASAFRRKKRVGVCLLLMVALQIYIGGSVESWTVAGAFGQRRFIALTTAMVIGYAAAWSAVQGSSGLRRRLFTGLTVIAVYWNLAMIAEFSTGLMDRQRLEPGRNAYDAFVTLPRQAPSLVYRYLFDRASFYKHGS
jgi:hypothetical protein